MFVWKKEFELGIPVIDAQHRQLLAIGNRLQGLLEAHREEYDSYDAILSVLAELKDYTIYHFHAEESLFRQYKYPDYELHKKEHDDFIAYLNSVDLNTIDEDQTQFMKDLLNKVIQWVFKHIISTDFLYKDFLIRLGAK
jgi:hemerythrin